MILPDSGERRHFESGAVRDISSGKGRCDLLPLDISADWIESRTLHLIEEFTRGAGTQALFYAIESFMEESNTRENGFPDKETVLLEVSKHFEDGAIKYGDNNWRKGIPVHCYIDSAIRHYLKWRRGDEDEPHNRAFVWNLLCAIWTMKHRPDLLTQDYEIYTKESI